MKYLKIMVFGLPGSGKSCFSDRLGKILQIPVYHLDKYFFLANWQKRNYDEFLSDLQKFVDQQQWIIDGNCLSSLETRFRRADAVIYFKPNILKCLFRIFKRYFNPDIHISDLPEGGTKNVRFDLLKYLWKFENRVKKEIEYLRKQYPNVDFFQFHNDKDAEYFIQRYCLPIDKK